MNNMDYTGLLPLDDKKAGILSRLRMAGCRGMADSLEQIYTDRMYETADFDTRMELLVRAQEAQLRESRKKSLLRASGLPQCPDGAIIKLNLPAGIDVTALERCSQKARALDRAGLILCGPTGIGKTTLLAYLGRCYCREGVGVLYRNTYDMTAALTSADTLKKEAMMRRLKSVQVLILDDFGIRGPLDLKPLWDLYTIIDKRWEEGRPTFVGSQIIGDEFSTALGGDPLADSVADRLRNPADYFELSGESKRKGLTGR